MDFESIDFLMVFQVLSGVLFFGLVFVLYSLNRANIIINEYESSLSFSREELIALATDKENAIEKAELLKSDLRKLQVAYNDLVSDHIFLKEHMIEQAREAVKVKKDDSIAVKKLKGLFNNSNKPASKKDKELKRQKAVKEAFADAGIKIKSSSKKGKK